MSVRNRFSRIVSHPSVFDAQTALLGARRLAEVLQPIAARTTQGRTLGTVVDVGGGTASGYSLWPKTWTYVSLDPDRRVVEHDTSGGTIPRIVGDASCMGFRDHSVDVVMMKGVSHHLDDASWFLALSEVRRILRSDGYFVFVDGVWSRRRWISRLGWALDTGRYPRASAEIERDVAESFHVESSERLTLLHDCVILTGRPHSAIRLEHSEQTGT
jgi:SAM-dependent methyltransferase